MISSLKARLDRSFALTNDLFAHLDEAALLLDIAGLPSNRIAAQVWCIAGARESYTTAIESGAWAGFSCSLTTPRSKQPVLAALSATRSRLAQVDFEVLTAAQVDLAFDLLEHEVQHHGQLIRFIYANGLSFPLSWNQRYTV
ncbi:MAG: hypothetical protein ACKVVT_17690 [Dehalococcoidia bacterium]